MTMHRCRMVASRPRHALRWARGVPVALALALPASAVAAQDGDTSTYGGSDSSSCVCPTTGANGTNAQGQTELLKPNQTQGDEPDDFEFESPREPFGREQTQGDEPDDFEFEPE